MPEQMAFRLIEPALQLAEPVQVICERGKPEQLLAQLALHNLDVVLADAPVGPFVKIQAFSHLLGECGVSFVGAAKLARGRRQGFPLSLDGAPFLLPADNSVLRKSLELWFEAENIRPVVRGVFADPALLKVFGENGTGIFAVRTAVEQETIRNYNVRLLGRITSIREQFYAISLERKLKHPAVVAITEAARGKLFA